jgi:D-sedoheptulose 7-phosphate isomerase
MNLAEIIQNHLQESARTKERMIETCSSEIVQAVKVISECFNRGGKLLICGNGGSAADAQHIAAEFVVRLTHDLKRPGLPALALTTDTSLLTAAGNDIGFEQVFARQIEALGRENDVLLAISTSGNSANILQAIHMARNKKMNIIGLSGGTGGRMTANCDIAIVIPSTNVQHIQEGHIATGHLLCELVERSLYPSDPA